MRFFLRPRRSRRRRPNRWSTCYRSVACPTLPPGQVRGRRFGWTSFGRRGLDPAEVYAFLDRVAAELTAAYDAVAASREESRRTRDALRRWQAEQFQARNERGWQR
ncbi:DivIVA domain-containing protein [Micromonospora sp. NPDC000207]|uniref:DivIVA domain-containing protein n=1 Tax=Micromonospora sp. NPDC000207 TaxID=3154246 RepID=UPI00331E58E1